MRFTFTEWMDNHWTPEWINSITSIILVIIAFVSLLIAINTVNEWKEVKRFDAFTSYYKILDTEERLINEVNIIINTFENMNEQDRTKYFPIFNDNLKNKYQNFIEISLNRNSETFIFFMNNNTIKKINELNKLEIELTDIIKSIHISKGKKINITKIKNKISEINIAINNVINESAKTIKNKEAFKF